MSTLAELAEQARLEAERVAASLREAEREEFTTGAREALKGLLIHDGQALTLTDLGMDRVHVDVDDRLAVWSDGTISLAVRQADSGWLVLLAQQQADGWHRLSEPLDSLAALGAARLTPIDRGMA